jgi:glyoxylase-like metal-dependent hydrolase (beta-lactamase superfamily II)
MAYRFDQLIVGFPGKSATHGGLGWASVGLLRDAERTVLVDTGPPQYTNLLKERLGALGVRPGEVTHVLTTHLHWDHISNFTMFPQARVVVGREELEWARTQPPGTFLVPDLHVARLVALSDRVWKVAEGEEFLPDVAAHLTPGHTPAHLAFSVRTTDGVVLFAGDAVKNRYELATGDVDSSLDFAESRASVERLRGLLCDRDDVVMVPGHDVRLGIDGGDVVALGEHDVDFQVFLSTKDGPQERRLA